MVLIFSVTSSPTLPSPRVAALTNLPSLYLIEIAKPSIFNSHIYSTLWSGTNFEILASKSLKSSVENVLDKLNIGTLCVIFSNSSNTLSPTRCVGEFSNIYSGWFSSSFSNCLYNVSYSVSDICGLSST